ncbi:mCG147073 [Mus musculus]|nr:mCG147073 [Mus musculus]
MCVDQDWTWLNSTEVLCNKLEYKGFSLTLEICNKNYRFFYADNIFPCFSTLFTFLKYFLRFIYLLYVSIL